MSRVLRRWLPALCVGIALVVGLVASPVLALTDDRAAAPTLVVEGSGPTSGTPEPGAYLTADLGRWSAEPTSFGFQWLRDGVAVDGATARDYLVQAADVGHVLAPKVTGSRDGAAASFTGTPSTVTTLRSTTSLQVRRTRLPGQDTRVWVAVAYVQTVRPWDTSGTVRLSEPGSAKALASGPVARNAVGAKLPGRTLRAGRHPLVACYSGNPEVAASCSPVVVVKPGQGNAGP